METGPGEPPVGEWRFSSLAAFADAVAIRAGRTPSNLASRSKRPPSDSASRAERPPSDPASRVERPPSRPLIIAVDGRGGSGKTTLATRLAAEPALAPAAVVHSDDVAWHHSRFGWDDPMIDGILRPLRAGRAVHFQPPGWLPHGRDGHIDIEAGLSAVLIEGVGVSRRSLRPLLDVAVWVQADYDEARRRGIRRDMAESGFDEETALREWWEWEAEEVPFLLDDRPWERADFIVGTTETVPDGTVALATR